MADYDIKWIKGDQFFDSSGDPLNGGLIRIYDAGTTTARTVYKDSAAGTAWTQPITLDSAGRLTGSIYVPTGTWKYALTTAADTAFATPIVTEDDLAGAVAAVSLTTARPETPILTKAINYTVVAADIGKLIQTDATGGDITITLISAVTAGSGANVWVQQTSSAGQTTVVPAGAQTVNGVSLITINRRYGIVKFISDGANWTASDVLADELTIASAATCNILAAASDAIAISGTTTITSFGTGVNKLKFVRATGAFTITHNATTLICPTEANITTVAGDTWVVVSDASSNVRIFGYQRLAGVPLAFADNTIAYSRFATAATATQADQETGTSTATIVTPGRQHFHPSAAKFWVKATANSTTIVISYNMTSWADTATGSATGTIATDFSGADWCGVMSMLDANGFDTDFQLSGGFGTMAAGTFRVDASGHADGSTVVSAVDPDAWMVAGFGDHA